MTAKSYIIVSMKSMILLWVAVFMFACKSQQKILIEQSLKQTHEAVTPTTQKATWAESWWMPRHESILEQNRNQQTDLIFIGNSIIHHWENAGKESWDKYFAKYNPVNMGFGGDRTQHVLWRLDNGELDGINPKLAIVMIGTNNAGSGDTAEMIADGVIQIVSRIRNALPDTKILLLGIFPRGLPDAAVRTTNATASALFSKVADNKVIFYKNINDIFLDENGYIPEEIMPDKLHPNAKGYELWAEAIIDTVNKLMKPTGQARHKRI